MPSNPEQVQDSCRYSGWDLYWDPRYTKAFGEILRGSGVEPIRLPARSPNLNAYAERFVRSIKEECLSQVVLLSEQHLRFIVHEYFEHYHRERNHQGLDNTY